MIDTTAPTGLDVKQKLDLLRGKPVSKVVSISDFQKPKLVEGIDNPEPEEHILPFNDQDIESFLRICRYLRTLNDDGVTNSATISITDDEFKLETKHYGDLEDGDRLLTAAILSLTGIIKFGNDGAVSETEDFKALIEGVRNF